jgi:hypothetical protein
MNAQPKVPSQSEKTTVRFSHDFLELSREADRLADLLLEFAFKREKVLFLLDRKAAKEARGLAEDLKRMARRFEAGAARGVGSITHLAILRESTLRLLEVEPGDPPASR